MKFYLNEQIIQSEDVLDVARSRWINSDQPWLVDIASTIISWYDKSDYLTIKTSGSTGIPKEIRHSKKSMIRSAQKTGKRFGLSQNMTSYNCLPARFIAGKMMIIRALVLGLDQVLVEPKVDPDTSFTGDIEFAAMTPMQVSVLMDSGTDFINQINCLIIGGAPVSPFLKKRLQGLKTRCFATYGMTETITHVAVSQLNGAAKTNLFEALDGIYFEKVNGCLLIHADHLDEHQIKTNDRIELSDKFHFKWLGRIDHVINSGGVKIHPEILENKLSAFIHHEFFVAGQPHEATSEKVILLIESPRYEKADYDELLNRLQRLHSGERPREIFFIPEFQRTPTGKIIRNLKLYEL